MGLVFVKLNTLTTIRRRRRKMVGIFVSFISYKKNGGLIFTLSISGGHMIT